MKLQATRGAQYTMSTDFNFNYQNWVVDSVDGAKKTLGSTVANSSDPAEPLLTGPVANTVVFDGINIPRGAVIHGGEVIVETAFVGPTAATLSVGIPGSTTALANAVDLKAAGRTALTLNNVTQLLCNDGTNIRLTFAYTVANATAGKVRVRVSYTIDGRTQEATTN